MFKSINKIVIGCVLSVFISYSNAGNVDYSQIEKNLNIYENKVKALRQSIDNSIFNDEEILIKFDFDTNNLISFMQEKIVFQPYAGLLRGVQGTLNSRAGNALDQAILLAKLLGDAGLETRIANGMLTEKLTKQLLSGIARTDIPTHIGQGAEFEKALAAFSKSNKTPDKIDWRNSETYLRYASTLKTLQKVFKDNNVLLADLDISQKLIAENKNYFWVEYRLSANEAWKSAHPAFAKGSKVDVKTLSTFKDSVPEKYLHQVRIEAFIQQRVGNNFKIHSLMKAWQKPAANLHNMLITYSNAPSGVNIKSKYNLEQILKDTNYFTPTFNGNAVGGKVFDLKGRLIDSMAMNSQAGALFKTLGDKTLSAIDKIENRKDGKSNMQLTAQWLQFTFIHPDGSEFTQKRYIFQADKDKELPALETKTKLLSEYSLLVNTGEQPISYLANVYLNAVEKGLPLLNSSARKLFHGEEKTAFPKSIPQSEFDLLTQYQWMNSNPNLSKDTIRYRSSANMLGFKKGFVDLKTAFFAVDVISNKQQFIKKQADKYFNATNETFKQGIWDTASEWLPGRFLKLEGNKVDTLKVTSAALEQDIKLKVVKSNINDSKNVTSRLNSDVNQGYIVIVPENEPSDMAMTGWWRINLQTGETLGMTADGGGSEVTEYLIELTAQSLMLVRALGNLQKCDNDNSLNNFEKMCCMAEAHLNNVGGLSFGGALGKAVGTAGAAVFDIADFTTELITDAIDGNTGTGVGIAPSTQGSICKSVGPIPDF